jgi:hypothetical protein
MSYDIYITMPEYTQEDGIMKGDLYLPGEPVLMSWVDVTCELCDKSLDHYIGNEDGESHYGDYAVGDHRGIIAVIYSPAQGAPEGVMEFVHLRCQLDAGCGIITANAHFSSTGRHFATA